MLLKGKTDKHTDFHKFSQRGDQAYAAVITALA